MTLHQAALYVKVASGDGAEEAVGQHPLDAATSSRLVIVDGVASPELSSLCSMPDGMYIGGIQNAPSQAVSQQLVSCGSSIKELILRSRPWISTYVSHKGA